MPPFMKEFEFSDDNEAIFLNSVDMIKLKLSKNMRLNMNEALTVYSAYVASEIRSKRSVENIEKNASKILTIDNVMIGVPETLRKITFDAMIDDQPKAQITFNEPIPPSNYMLTTENIRN
ncbi:MAG: urease subunit gamma [Nitrosopumilaceae archaeon]